MKLLAAAALLAGSASAFQASMTFSLGGKKKAAPAKKKVSSPAKGIAGGPAIDSVWAGAKQSEALPYATAPNTLDGSYVGDAGFDPLGFSAATNDGWLGLTAFESSENNLKWLREAEIIHGRISQLAVLGFIWPGAFGHFAGNAWTGVDAYAQTNPLLAWGEVPGLATAQIVAFMAALELRRVLIIIEDGPSHIPGDYRWGQGEGRWNPFGFNYTPEQYAEKQLQELKNGRLAMIGIFGLFSQALLSGESVADQLRAALTYPDYVAKAGYFLPEGI